MALQDIAGAMQRVETVLRQRPAAGLGEDVAALVRWDGGLVTRARHASGAEITTDLPAEIGGGGLHPSPGWFLRMALASCAVTRIAMEAAAEGIALQTLTARASSRSDARGLLGMCEADGRPVDAGPGELRLQVCIGAPGVAAERLRALVRRSAACSPVQRALEQALPVAVEIDVQPEGEA